MKARASISSGSILSETPVRWTALSGASFGWLKATRLTAFCLTARETGSVHSAILKRSKSPNAPARGRTAPWSILRSRNKRRANLSFAAGFSSVDAFLIDLSVSQRNLRGRGQTLIARVSASDRQQFVDFRFQEPRFLDRNLSAGLELFSTRSDFLDVSDFESETIGAGVSFRLPGH